MSKCFVAVIAVLLMCSQIIAVTPVQAQDVPVPSDVRRDVPETPPPPDPAVPLPAPEPLTEMPPAVELEDPQIEFPPFARSLQFTGNTVIPSDELAVISGISPGQVVSRTTLEIAAANIEGAYRRRGYIAQIGDVELPPPGQAGTVTLHILELRIAEIRVEGLQRTQEVTVRRVLTTQPGDLFNRAALTRDYVQLQQLGLFEEINYRLEPTEPGQSALTWLFVEREQFNFVQLSGTYSPQDGLVGRGQLTFGNLRGRAERLNLIGSIGSIDARVGGQVDYFSPWIAPRRTSLLLSAFAMPQYRFSRDLALDTGDGRYFERRTGFRTLIGRPIRPYLTAAVGVRYESVGVNNLPVDLLTNGENQDGNVFMASARGVWEQRNSAFDPATGTYTVGFIEGGRSRPDAGGSDGIAKAWIDRRWYYPLRPIQLDPGTGIPTERVPVFAVRGVLAGSVGDLPFFEQFFVGGTGDLPLRGYLPSRFWGKYAVIGSVEYRRPFSRQFTGVAFVDAGDAWASDFQFTPGATTDFRQHDGFSPRFGAGVGIRYLTPVGPLRVDFAYGEEFRTELTVGEAF